MQTNIQQMHSGDAADRSWRTGPAPRTEPPAEWDTARAAPAANSGQRSDAWEAGSAERKLLLSSRQPFLKPGGRGHDSGPLKQEPPLPAPTFQQRSRPVPGPGTTRQHKADEAAGGAFEEGGLLGAAEAGRRNPLTLRFKVPDLERRFRTRHAKASGFADSVGDLFLLVLCLVALLARAKSLREGAVIASLALVCLAKMLLRARGRDAYLRHRVVIISAQRIAMMLSSGLIGRIQLARPRVYVISGSLVSLCGALFINTRLVTFTLNPTILPLPWAEDLVTTLGGLGMLLALLVPKFCIPEHLSHPPTEASVQYLASAIDELCAGALPLGPQSRGQGAAQVQCRQLHVFAQVFWGCIVPLTAAYIIESRERAAFAQQSAPPAALEPDRDASIGLGLGHQRTGSGASSSSVQGSHGDGWQAEIARGFQSTAPRVGHFTTGIREPSGDTGGSSGTELLSPIAADLLVAAALLPVVGAALWQLMRICMG